MLKPANAHYKKKKIEFHKKSERSPKLWESKTFGKMQ